ncbi:hypothetical protein VNO78_16373 [Psophocarpus tetragonolobus]|uniref:Uncharacterized protein n=1 Tax=Psophocarpus tetragonolobus TaxID=3891 RepID=A0AAN9XKQ8_PSOTE
MRRYTRPKAHFHFTLTPSLTHTTRASLPLVTLSQSNNTRITKCEVRSSPIPPPPSTTAAPSFSFAPSRSPPPPSPKPSPARGSHSHKNATLSVSVRQNRKRTMSRCATTCAAGVLSLTRSLSTEARGQKLERIATELLDLNIPN